MLLPRALAASGLWAVALLAQPASLPSVEVNYPGLNPNRYINLTLDWSLHHVFAAGGEGKQGEMAGVPLAAVLETAGWGQIPKEDVSQYLVRLEGDETATLPLSEVLRRSLDNRAWLVIEQGGKPLSRTEVPVMVAVASGGQVTLSVKHVQRIRVTNVTTHEPHDDVEFDRLSGYEAGYKRDEAGRTLWKKYVRVEGVPVMIVTSSTGGRLEKNAVLWSEQVSDWSDRRLFDFLAGSVALAIEGNGTIERVGGFTVVRLRFPL